MTEYFFSQFKADINIVKFTMISDKPSKWEMLRSFSPRGEYKVLDLIQYSNVIYQIRYQIFFIFYEIHNFLFN